MHYTILRYAAIFLFLGLAACSPSEETSAPSHTGGEVAAKMKEMGTMMHHMLGSADSNYDSRFISTMTMHHMGAIRMSKYALATSNRAEIRDLATKMIDAQGSEIDSLRAWNVRWYGKEPMLDDAMMKQDSVVVGMLGPSGNQYDDNFIDAMIEHHSSAIAMAKDALKNAARQELKSMSAAIISSQSAEIDTLKTWRMRWYSH